MKQSGLKGVVVPLVTPLTPNGECDVEAVRRLVERVISGGVDGLMPAGTTGEALALPTRVRHTLVDTVCEATAGRARVVAGIGSACLEDVLDHARQAKSAGADVVALHPPPYFPMDEASLRHFYVTVLEEVELPLALYTIPSFAVNCISPDLVEELCAHEHVVALKDSTGSADYRREVLARCGPHGVGVFAGDEFSIVDAAKEGAIGCVPSSGNLFPEEFARLWSLCESGAWEGAHELQSILNARVAEVLGTKGGWLGMMRWLKTTLSDVGVCEPQLASIFSTDPEGLAMKVN